MFPDFLIKKEILKFLEEDLYMGDITEIPDCIVEGKIISKESGIIAGIEIAKIAFQIMNIEVLKSVGDGSRIDAGEVVMEVRGRAKNIFMSERTVLNILMRMSGVATATAKMVEKARKINPKIAVAGTRKTTPGFRIFEKMAIEIGGGDPHRITLTDCVLIKHNHVAVIGDLSKAIRVVKAKASFTKKIEVEVRGVEEALKAAREDVDIIMLDNMNLDDIHKAVKALEKEGLRKKVILEASGGIDLENVEAYASTGVDVISSGFLTHSSKALDLSLVISKTETLKNLARPT